MFKHRRLIMLSTVAVLAAVVFFSTIADYLPCGDSLRRAVRAGGVPPTAYNDLAETLIHEGKAEEAEKALATAVRCAADAKVQTEARNTLDLTQARLWKVQGKMAELRTLVQSLKRRENLRPDQQCVLNWLEKGI